MGLDELRKCIDLKERIDSKAIDIGRNAATFKHGKKPLMERYRRQKINKYLEELKCLVLTALNKEVSLYNKMEKADILDMAVRYIKAVRPATMTETSTIQFAHQPADSTTVLPGYRVRSPSPPRVRSINFNYDNLHQSSRETQENNMKENCIMTYENKRLLGRVSFPLATRTRNTTQYLQDQFVTPMHEKTFSDSLTSPSESCEPNAGSEIPTKIWRPW